jgi:hypothetical protein
MTEVVENPLTHSEAERITERIRLTVDSTSRNLAKLAELVAEAFSRRADLAMGYGSWDEYSRAEFGEKASNLAPEFRRQLVSMLSAEGMSPRAISGVAGVDRSTISRDRKALRTQGVHPAHPEGLEATSEIPRLERTVVKDTQDIRAEVIPEVSPAPTPETPPTGSTLATTDRVIVAEQRHVDMDTGEVIEPTPEPRKVTGLDGKRYTRPKPRPKPHVIDTAEEAELVNARTSAKRIGIALITFQGFTVPEHRQRVLTRWWPLGKENVPPDERELFQPTALRAIAEAINQLALEMEALEHEQL